MNVSQIIQYFGYSCENHEVVTEDGYILSIQRIPYGKNKVAPNDIVFLQHGLLDSAATWVMNLPNQSFAFILADKGFDVWLGNSRGNTYSNRHVNLSTSDAHFWEFSFDEMAKYDLPAVLNYVLKHTGNSQLHYVGHSQGTTIGFIEFGRNPELGKKIKGFHALAPIATVGHIKGAMKVLSNFAAEVQFLYKILGMHQFCPSGWATSFLTDIVCTATSFNEEFCGDVMFLMTGFDQKNLNMSRIAIYATHTPAGTSVRNVVHYVQMIRSGKFQMYDHGSQKNKEIYGQPTPPVYDVSQVNTPVTLFTGSHDWLADPYDVNTNLRPYLQNIIYSKNIDGFNHMDFIWGEHANSVLFYDIIRVMKGNK